jgi:F0F1-type ATP synthase assembly protein I
VAKQPDSSSPLGLVSVFEWVSRITTIGLCFAVPPVIGFVLDRWWNWAPAGILAGAVLGFAAGTQQTLTLARQLPGSAVKRNGRSRGEPEDPGSRSGGE